MRELVSSLSDAAISMFLDHENRDPSKNLKRFAVNSSACFVREFLVKTHRCFVHETICVTNFETNHSEMFGRGCLANLHPQRCISNEMECSEATTFLLRRLTHCVENNSQNSVSFRVIPSHDSLYGSLLSCLEVLLVDPLRKNFG